MMTIFNAHLWRTRFITIALIASVGSASLWLGYRYLDRTPGELMRYAEHRLIGHPKLEYIILPIFKQLRPYIERPINGFVPSLGKGQQAQPLPSQHYSAEGGPSPVDKSNNVRHETAKEEPILLTSMADIEKFILQARPGQVLEIAPGIYSMSHNISVHHGGDAQHQIIVRAKIPGSVVIESSALEGFHLYAPYWIFENLVIRGVCKVHSNCEHAFHVVGKARSIVIRNNRIEDFNAHIKVNGLGMDWPDYGLIQYNTLNNTRKRDTQNPTTPIDIVGADHWQITDNLITNFVKGDGNQISYGAFMKGGGSNGRIERNVVICTDQDISQPGSRIGLSLGGGGTGPLLCRDQRCITEYSQGTIANNVIAHCNDFGIYINNSNQSTITKNILANTYGIDIRFPASSAFVDANVLDGTIRSRDGAEIKMGDNRRTWTVNFPQVLEAILGDNNLNTLPSKF